ncbi:MAG: FlxA-like family protein [Acidobacteria bacterium]|nr:FlxA-like family protein [Acidobacteriota bacterium]
MMDGFPEVAALLHVVEQMFHQKGSHEPMLLEPSFFTDGCTKEGLLQSFNESKSYIQARLEAATTQGSQQTLQAPAHTPTTNLNFYIGRVCADPSRSEVCAVTHPLLHKAITHFGEESNARLHTPLPSLSFLDRRGFFSYNESYNVNRDIGTILDFFGIKRKKQQTTIEGKRTWEYSIDGETVIHVLLDAKKELDRWVSKAAKATPEEVAKRISTTLEAKLQDEGSRVVLTTPQRRTKQTALSEERQEIAQTQSEQTQSDQAQRDQIQRTPFVVQPNVIFGSGYERGLVVWLAPSELAEVFQHKDPITRACLACWFYDPVKGNGRYLTEAEGGRTDRL